MRFKHTLTVGLLLAVPGLVVEPRVAAGWPLCGSKDCASQDTTVRLPAQEIRIETTRPRVIVNEGPALGRSRSFAVGVPMGYGAPFMPMMSGQPFVASIYVPATSGFGSGPTASSSTLRALHELENQTLEVARQKAILKAETDHINMVHKRITSALSATLQSSDGGTADTTQLQKSIDDLSKRISDVERLLLIHDNAIKNVQKNQTGK
jgi:hypothetical protein